MKQSSIFLIWLPTPGTLLEFSWIPSKTSSNLTSYKIYLQMLGTFPKSFPQTQLPKGIFQAVSSHGYFQKWQLPNCAISQVATSQVYPSCRAGPHRPFFFGAWPPSPSQPWHSPHIAVSVVPNRAWPNPLKVTAIDKDRLRIRRHFSS